MKILLAQISISKSHKKNLSKILDIIQNHNFDILLFPELALTSYDLKKAVDIPDKSLRKSLKSIQESLGKKQRVIVGTITKIKGSVYNSAAVISKKRIKYYHKNTLTDYDELYFKRGKDILAFTFKSRRIGILICRDQDNLKLIEKYRKKHCDVLLQLSAHYYNVDTAIRKLDKNIAMPIVRAMDSGALFCKVNAVGKSGDQISLGSSMVVDPSGQIYRKANIMTEELVQFNTGEQLC